MNIGFDQNTTEVSGGKFIQINSKEDSIQAGRFLNKIEVGQLDDGTNWIEVEVRNAENQIANRRWFEPKKGGFVESDDDLKKAQNKVNKVMANLVRRIKGDQFTIQAATYGEFFQKVKEAIEATPGWNQKEMRIKVVLKETQDGGFFPTLPAYAPIFEEVSVNPTQLRVTQWDVVVPTSTASPSSDGETGVVNTSTVPEF